MKYREAEITLPKLDALVRPSRFWTEKEDAIIKAYYPKVPVRVLMDELNKACGGSRSVHAIQQRAHMLRLEGRL